MDRAVVVVRRAWRGAKARAMRVVEERKASVESVMAVMERNILVVCSSAAQVCWLLPWECAELIGENNNENERADGQASLCLAPPMMVPNDAAGRLRDLSWGNLFGLCGPHGL